MLVTALQTDESLGAVRSACCFPLPVIDRFFTLMLASAILRSIRTWHPQLHFELIDLRLAIILRLLPAESSLAPLANVANDRCLTPSRCTRMHLGAKGAYVSSSGTVQDRAQWISDCRQL